MHDLPAINPDGFGLRFRSIERGLIGSITMAYSAKAVANEILRIAGDRGISVSPMKLQKLVYYSHGWHLAVTGEPLIDEQVEAWEYGPVVRTLFHEFKEFGNGSIERYATSFKKTGEGIFDFTPYTPSMEDEAKRAGIDPSVETLPVLNRVFDVYGGLTATRLSNMTHEPGGPWDQIVKLHRGSPPRGTDIPMHLIREHFTASLQKHLDEPSRN